MSHNDDRSQDSTVQHPGYEQYNSLTQGSGQAANSGQGEPGYPQEREPKHGQPVGKISKTWLIIGIVIAVLVVVAIIIALVVKSRGSDSTDDAPTAAATSDELTAQDFTEGSTQVTAMQTEFSHLNDALSTIFPRATEVDKGVAEGDVTKVTQALESFDDANTKFGELKVAKIDNVKEAYDAYQDKAEQYDAFVTTFADDSVALSSALSSCVYQQPSASTFSPEYYVEYEDIISTCKSDLEPLKDSSDKAISDFVTAMNTYVDNLSDIIGKMKVLGDSSTLDVDSPEYAQYEDLSEQFYSLDSPTNLVTDLNDALNKEQQQADVSGKLHEIEVALSEAQVAQLRS